LSSKGVKMVAKMN